MFKTDDDDRSCLVIIQCHSGHLNGNLIACARHRIYDIRAQSGESNRTHILFIIHLPHQVVSSSFAGFQGDPWISAHIDDLIPTSDNTVAPFNAIGLSISELFIGKLHPKLSKLVSNESEDIDDIAPLKYNRFESTSTEENSEMEEEAASDFSILDSDLMRDHRGASEEMSSEVEDNDEEDNINIHGQVFRAEMVLDTDMELEESLPQKIKEDNIKLEESEHESNQDEDSTTPVLPLVDEGNALPVLPLESNALPILPIVDEDNAVPVLSLVDEGNALPVLPLDEGNAVPVFSLGDEDIEEDIMNSELFTSGQAHSNVTQSKSLEPTGLTSLQVHLSKSDMLSQPDISPLFKRLYGCIQAAVSRLKDNATKRSTKRVEILVHLIPKNPSSIPGTNAN